MREGESPLSVNGGRYSQPGSVERVGGAGAVLGQLETPALQNPPLEGHTLLQVPPLNPTWMDPQD